MHGSKGLIEAGNHRATSVTVATGQGYTAEPLANFFATRYADAYRIEIATFCNAVVGKAAAYPDGADGLKALLLADAALESFKSGKETSLA